MEAAAHEPDAEGPPRRARSFLERSGSSTRRVWQPDGKDTPMEIRYALVREFPHLDYDDAVEKVTKRLSDEGFGVLTEIDVKATLKKKLDLDFRRYVILGACNPHLAHRALDAEPHIGVLLPCNVVVMEREGGGSIVSAFKPTAAFEMVDNPQVQPVAGEVEARLRRVLDGLA